MTKYASTPRRGGNHLALWAGVSSLFATLLGVATISLFNPDYKFQILGVLAISVITGSTVYTRQKLDDAKTERLAETVRVHGGQLNITTEGDKKIFSLELEGDPEALVDAQEVTFVVNSAE